LALPPLALYVHLPWCVRKCPYCDFNSHPLTLVGGASVPDEAVYIAALLADLDQELSWLADQGGNRQRPLIAIFLGGGTPSLFSAEAIGELLRGVRERLDWGPDIEVTLEANPGTAEAARFAGYRAAGVNRLSIGVQSFAAPQLAALGRIHGAAEAVAAFRMAREAGFERVNLDLMFGLPGQTESMAIADLERAVALQPSHLSWYQLTLEPNTEFARRPPVLPDDDRIWAIQRAGRHRLARAGYRQYEVSAYARAGDQCRHNLNYWQFGDYLGIGAGAHGKLTQAGRRVVRRWKARHPREYLRSAGTPGATAGEQVLAEADLRLEFMLNALRLVDGVEPRLFAERTGLDLASIDRPLQRARQLGLLEADALRPTEFGRRFLNDLVNLFAAG
jgi:oxygen-independent coproporphyrinogen-3 oxidase